MPTDELFSENSLQVSQHAQIDKISLRFEKAWLSGRAPSLEEHVEQIGASPKLRTALFRELLALEVHYRKQKGEEPAFAEYRKRFPEYSDAAQRLFGHAAPGDSSGPLTSRAEEHEACESDSLSFDASSTSREAAHGDERPRKLGRYEIVKLVGKGKFGRVYLGKDTQLDRLVAIKVSRSHLFSSEESAANFLSEARKVAQLDRHSGIVTVHDVGEWNKKCYIVMDYIEGGTLADPKIEQHLEFHEIAMLLAQVADAVHDAHRKGVVHRDIKPGNILLDGNGHPRVADFGLAVYESEQPGKKGEISGTLLYMSPEQAGGHTERLDGRTDVWSLGATLYELLTKRKPFTGKTSDEIIDQILHREVKPPRQIDDTIPVDLERICLTALSKLPTERYNTAHDLAQALRRVSAKLEQDRATRRRRIGIALAAIAIAIAIWWFPRRDPPIPPDPRPGPSEQAGPGVVEPQEDQEQISVLRKVADFPILHDEPIVSVHEWHGNIAFVDRTGIVWLYDRQTGNVREFVELEELTPGLADYSKWLASGRLICLMSGSELQGRVIPGGTPEFSWPLTLAHLTAAYANDRIAVAGYAERENRWRVMVGELVPPDTELQDVSAAIPGGVCDLDMSESGQVLIGGYGPDVGIRLAGIGMESIRLDDSSDSRAFYHRVAIAPDDSYAFAVSRKIPRDSPEQFVLRVWSIDRNQSLDELIKPDVEIIVDYLVQAVAYLPAEDQILIADSESIELWKMQRNTRQDE